MTWTMETLVFICPLVYLYLNYKMEVSLFY